MLIVNHGTVVQFIPNSKAEFQLLHDTLDTEPWQWMRTTLVLDHRVAGNVLAFLDSQVAADSGGATC